MFLQPDTCVTLGTRSACRWRHHVVASGGGSPSAGSRCIVFASSEPTEESLKGRWTSPPTLKPTPRGRCSPTWACKHEDYAHHVQKNESVPGGTAVTHMWVGGYVGDGGRIQRRSVSHLGIPCGSHTQSRTTSLVSFLLLAWHLWLSSVVGMLT